MNFWLRIAVVVGVLGFAAGMGVTRWATGEGQARADRIEQVARKADALAQRIIREGRERRDQSCRGVELGHQQEIIDLTRTYRFYADPPAGFKNLLSNPVAQEGLHEDERNAQKDQDKYGVFVPPFCDEKGIGLPEPDPEVPERPAALKSQVAP